MDAPAKSSLTSPRGRFTIVGMELRHLRTVVAVATHGSFTKAAEELHLAQSAVSQQIGRLEAELGMEIFRRSSRRVEVTAEGQVILDHAHRVLAEVDDLHAQLADRTGLLRGKLAIGGMYPFGRYDLYGVLADFRASYPDVEIHMVEDTQDAVLAKLRTDELDCAFTSVDTDDLGDEFAATLIWEEEFVVAFGPDHPLAAERYVTLERLADEPLVAYRDNSALRRRLEGAFEKRALEPVNAFVCTEMGAVRELASRGLGAAMLPRSIAEQPGPPIALVPFGPEPLTWPTALVWRATRRQPPAAKAFLQLAIARAEGEADAPAPPSVIAA
jgi:DNA-binding transcriptional LysR family regulator